MIQWGVLVLAGSSLVAADQAGGAGVKAIGVYPLLLPGLQAVAAGRPKVQLWCRGAKLVGIMVQDESQPKAAPAAQGRSLPSALPLRDGRCESNGGVSFGFLVPVKAWIFDTGARGGPEERTTWLLHRFQGTVSDRRLKGVLVQVDVSHPGFAFPETKVEVEAIGDDPPSFADEKAWLDEISRTFSVVRSEP
ncbi:MAG TPA: hypothetical protein VMT70_15465 [Vicinamibacteria bacterium]|nr:hypothetical protein [Vicinamibacteria bacterium]